MTSLEVIALEGLPFVEPGDDLVELIVSALKNTLGQHANRASTTVASDALAAFRPEPQRYYQPSSNPSLGLQEAAAAFGSLLDGNAFSVRTEQQTGADGSGRVGWRRSLRFLVVGFACEEVVSVSHGLNENE